MIIIYHINKHSPTTIAHSIRMPIGSLAWCFSAAFQHWMIFCSSACRIHSYSIVLDHKPCERPTNTSRPRNIRP